MNDGLGGTEYKEIASVFPNVVQYLQGNLYTGNTYGFTIKARNYNGFSPSSDPAFFLICTAPGQLSPANMSAVTATKMTLEWKAPVTTGGCPITSYSIFQQELFDPSQFAEVDADEVNNLIALRSHSI